MNQIETQINRWLDELERVHGRGAATAHNYHFYLKRFLAWSKITTAKEIDRALLDRYRQWLGSQKTQRRKTLEYSTQNYHLIALRAFLAYLRHQHQPILAPEQIKLFQLRVGPASVLINAELQTLLDAPLKSDEAELIRLRDKALLELLFATGLRVAELSRLTRKSIGQTLTVTAAGKPERQLALNNQSRYWLDRYLKKRTDNSLALFVRFDRARGKQTSSITPRSIQRLIRHYAVAAGMTKKVTPQIIRNSVAHRLLTNGTNIATVQKKLGHSSATTTRRYQFAAAPDR